MLTPSNVDPWLVVGLAAFYQQERDMFDAAGIQNMTDAYDNMLLALQQLAGVAIHDDQTYFTYGPGNEEYLKNAEVA